MIRYFLFTLMILISSKSYTQLDSLQQQYKSATHWKEEINALSDLVSFYSSSDTSKVMEHIGYMKNIAEEQNDNKSRYQVATALASFYTKTSRYELAQSAMSDAYKISIKMNDPEMTSSILGNLGVLKYYTNDLDSAKYYLDTAYQIKKTLEVVDTSNLSRNLTSLAQISRMLHLFEDAVSYQMEAMKLGEASGNHSTYLGALSGLAGLYGDLEEEEKAFSTELLLLKKSKEFGDLESLGVSAKNLGVKYRQRGQLDSAFYYYKLALTQFEKIGYVRGLSEVHIAFGDWYFNRNEFNQSEEYYNTAYEYAVEIGDDRLIASGFNNLGSVYVEQGKFAEAKTSLLRGLNLFKELDYIYGINESYGVLRDLNERTGNWESAFNYQEQYHTMTDSLNKEKFNGDVKNLEIKYETELKDAEIKRQHLFIQNQENKQQTLLGYFGLFLLLAMSVIFILYQRAKKNKVISKKNLEIKNRKIAELKNENKILAMVSMIEGQELERKRIAQDLHDGLGGILSTVKIQVKNISKEIAEFQQVNLISKTEQLIDSAYSEVRRISYDMMPGALVKLGLFAAVEDLADQVNKANGVKVNTQWYHDENVIPEKTKVILYRIIQEAVSNALKYADAENILIQMSENDGFINLTIEDDGIGFDAMKIDEKKKLGLNSIKSRVEYLNGQLEILTGKDEGVTYEIVVPVRLDEK